MFMAIPGAILSLRARAAEREAWVERLEERFAPIASALGLVFVLVVIGENLAVDGSTLEDVFFVTGWAIWLVFVAEFVLRAIVAPSTWAFLRRNWWQVLFLVLPFLRFIAALRLARFARAGRIVSSAVRGTRSAGQMLRDRITWIAIVHAIVVLAASQMVFEFGEADRTYGEVLHAVALASVSGEPLGIDTGLARVLEVLLAFYAMVVFATAAGVLGAYFLDRTDTDRSATGAGPPDGAPPHRS
jgi:voltage-gated potassium channel